MDLELEVSEVGREPTEEVFDGDDGVVVGHGILGENDGLDDEGRTTEDLRSRREGCSEIVVDSSPWTEAEGLEGRMGEDGE